MTEDVITLASNLIKKRSISPYDAGCQQHIISRLAPLGFFLDSMTWGDTTNLWAYHGEKTSPTIVFAGHTDVVPAGNEKNWHSPPFEATIDDNGILYGRGAADMKGSLAAMICAAEEYITEHPDHNGRIAFLITSDEEATGQHGTIKVVEKLKANNEPVHYCIIGEPTSHLTLGDQIKNGRRGSLIANLTIYGKQGHIAYPHRADNPIHNFAPALNELLSIEWDNGNHYFPKTTMQFVNMYASTQTENIIPGEMQVQFGFRYSSELTDIMIKRRVKALLDKHKLRYQLNWRLSGKPFLTKKGILTQAATDAIFEITKIKTTLSTGGGTSDGRFIATLGCEIIEIGPVSASIHQANEHIATNDIVQLKKIYKRILEKLIN